MSVRWPIVVASSFLALVAASARADSRPPLADVVDGSTARYLAYLEYPETGEARTVVVTMTLVARPSSARDEASYAAEWRDENGLFLPDESPYSELPRGFTANARGFAIDAIRTRLTTPFAALPPRPARLGVDRFAAYLRDERACLESEHPGADPADYRTTKACFDESGVLREFLFDSATASLELDGPLTRGVDLVGEWSARDDAEDRTFAAELSVDPTSSLLSGRFVTSSAWSTECSIAEVGPESHPESVEILMRCVERITPDVGDDAADEHRCGLSLVAGRLSLDHCPVLSMPLARVPPVATRSLP